MVSRGAQVALRLSGLALVNFGVYLVYVKAIRAAKLSGAHGSFHEGGASNYDEIVAASYRNYLASGDMPESDERLKEEGRERR